MVLIAIILVQLCAILGPDVNKKIDSGIARLACHHQRKRTKAGLKRESAIVVGSEIFRSYQLQALPNVSNIWRECWYEC